MTPWMANAVLNARKRRIKGYNNARFHKDGYEFRLMYKGGFFGYLEVSKRPYGFPRGRFAFVDMIPEDDLGMEDVIGYIKSRV